ncbi:DUF6515 family protein [uncultured Aquimarina sp.]|uniref:DUF6515 family protein n=1 Tax=uncultured Aquimarina sp. TaxID=575652 RepID=UPI0026243E3B|nr:DUF6515 family protein [uncultured Aquimarina sp.]
MIESKKYIHLIILLSSFFLFPNICEAQVVRSYRGKKVVVVKTNNITRKRIRRNRRLNRRTLRNLPAGTKRIVFRKVNYYSINGSYYIQKGSAYHHAFPPVGFRIKTIQGTVTRLVIAGITYSYINGIFYKPINDEFEIVLPPAGAVIKKLPEDSIEVQIEGINYYTFNNTIYKAVGKEFEVVAQLD